MNRNTRTTIVLVIAIVAAGIATWLVNRAIQQRPVQQVQAPTARIVAAAKPLLAGVRLTTDDVKLVPWPNDAPIVGSFTKVEDVVNRGTISSIGQNEPLSESKLAPVGSGAGLPPAITPGMRAISVRVNDVVGVAGFVTPGNRVDVFVTLKKQDTSLTKVVTSNVQVLASGTKLGQDEAAAGQAMPSTVVTLLLSPEDAERVVLASTEGQIMLALRNPLDHEPTATTGTALTALYGEPAAAPKIEAPVPVRVVSRPARAPEPVVIPPPPPKPYTVETIRGAKRTEEAIR